MCLNTIDSVYKVTFEENIVVDPNDDPNLSSEIEVSYCSDHITSTEQLEKEMEGIYIFPNPADNYFKINNNHLKGSILIQILNVSGDLIFEQNMEASELSMAHFNLTSLNPGLYFVQIIQGSIKTIDKLIIH